MACAAPSPSLPPTCVNCGKDSFIYEHCSVCNGPIHDAVGFCDTSEHEGKLYCGSDGVCLGVNSEKNVSSPKSRAETQTEPRVRRVFNGKRLVAARSTRLERDTTPHQQHHLRPHQRLPRPRYFGNATKALLAEAVPLKALLAVLVAEALRAAVLVAEAWQCSVPWDSVNRQACPRKRPAATAAVCFRARCCKGPRAFAR
eukprot:m.467160 g.467160  ORF g.467160 m.467160 type:complete len:200 (+) comp20364_c0_seq18:112-711(+)